MSGGYVAQYAHDQSNDTIPPYDFVPFPPRGYIPGRYITRGHAWSVSLDPARYTIPDEKAVTVTVTPLGRRLRPAGQALRLEFFTVSSAPYGTSPCIIFRPDFATGFNRQRFLVTVDGVTKTDPRAADVRYVVEIGS
jgi:hypothetical protein